MNGYGNRFSNKAYECGYADKIAHYYVWSTQPRPVSRTRSVWYKALRETFTKNQQGILTYTLGQWSINDIQWKWYYHTSPQLLYKRRHNNLSWKVYKRTSRGGQIGATPTFRYVNEALVAPRVATRAIVVKLAYNTFKMTGWSLL